MRRSQLWLIAALSVSSVALPLALPAARGQQLDREMLHRKQESQLRARDAARDLVSSVLDIQLQQLEENGLETLPLFTDIKQMRNNIDGLVEAEMAEVVALLLKAQGQEPAERGVTFVAARQKIRDVVVRLSIERQNLLRRLKTAELAAHVKRLISMQSLAQEVTHSLAELPQARQESQLLATIQDQRDIKAMYLRLVETMNDVRNWGGDVGQGAGEGLSILRAAGVDARIDAAIHELETAEFQPAVADEAAVLKGLRLLLEKIEETQGLVGTDRSLALETVRDLIKAQQKVREETKAAELTEKTADPLVEKQTAIQKELGRLPEMLSRTPEASTLVEQAKAAAYDATGKLFDAKRDAALEDQAKVLRNLAAVEQQLVAAEQSEDGLRSSDEQDKLVRDLERTERDVKAAQARTAELQKTPPEKNAQAAPEADKLAKNLAQIPPGRELPAPVRACVNEAAESARQAAAALNNDPQNEPQKQATLAATAEDLQRAAAEIASALADAKRMRLATQIGELNRAAEALDRAAAAEHNAAQEAKQAAQKKGLDAVRAKELAAQQGVVRELARDVAKAVAKTAPDASRKLAKAAPNIDAAEAALRDATGQAMQEEPQAAKRAATAKAAGERAEAASEQLADAARQLRDQIVQAARALQREASEQLAAVTPVRQDVEQAATTPRASLADKLERLNKAKEKAAEAGAEQQRAAGSPQAAEAMQLAERIKQARERQAEANEAARALSEGKAATPLTAATRQQEAADDIGRVAQQATTRPEAPPPGQGQRDELADALDKARQAAAQAAKQTLDGNHNGAQAKRQEAGEALKKAQRLAEAEAQRAQQAPPGKPDPAAQQRATEAAHAAKDLAAADAPAAAETLGDAAKQSQAAGEKMQAGEQGPAQNAQQQASAALDQAQQELDKASQELARQQVARMQAQGQLAAQMAKRAAAVDPAARAALRAAERHAGQAGEPQATPHESKAAEQALMQDLERATANLTAREEQVRRDERLAAMIAEAAQMQQAAVEQIRDSGEALGQAMNKPATDTSPAQPSDGNPSRPSPAASSPEAQKIARQLREAMQQFAGAEQRAGEAAEQVAGQGEVASSPLRDALAAGDQLPATGDEMGQPAAPEPSNGQPASAKSSEPKNSAGMGRQFQPASADATAQMLAGPEALDQLDAIGEELVKTGTRQDGTASQQNGKPPTGQQAQQSPQAGEQSNEAKAAMNKSAQANQGQQAPEGEGAARAGDVKQGERTFREEPWVAKLPPELRQAIRAQSQRPPPRGYEERLRRYFENTD